MTFDTPLPQGTRQPILASVILVPAENEDGDLETLGIIEEIRMDIWDDISSRTTYKVEIVNDGTRDSGILHLLGDLLRGAIAHADLVKAVFQAGATAITYIAKHRHVKKIEISLDGDTISIFDADYMTVQRLLALYEARHPDKLSTLTSPPLIEVSGTISRIEQPASPVQD